MPVCWQNRFLKQSQYPVMRLRAIITAPTAMRANGIATKMSGCLINQSNPSTEAKMVATTIGETLFSFLKHPWLPH